MKGWGENQGTRWMDGGVGCCTSLVVAILREPVWGDTLGGGAISSSCPGWNSHGF